MLFCVVDIIWCNVQEADAVRYSNEMNTAESSPAQGNCCIETSSLSQSMAKLISTSVHCNVST